MDPNANITEQRELAQSLIDGVPANGYAVAERLAELVLALDEWRRGGGFDPYERQSVTYEVKGRITLADGSTSDFIIERDTGYQQWGATTERLGATVDLIHAMADAVAKHFPASEEDER